MNQELGRETTLEEIREAEKTLKCPRCHSDKVEFNHDSISISCQDCAFGINQAERVIVELRAKIEALNFQLQLRGILVEYYSEEYREWTEPHDTIFQERNRRIKRKDRFVKAIADAVLALLNESKKKSEK